MQILTPLRWPLTVRLLVLVALALLPALGIEAYNELGLRRARAAAVRAEALGGAHEVSRNLDRVVEGIRQVLVAVAAAPVIRSKDPVRCSEYLASLASAFPRYMLIGVNDADGAVICDSSGSAPGSRSEADRAYHQRALATGAFAIGDQFLDEKAGKRSLHFALPFRKEGGAIDGIVLAGIDLDWLADDLSASGLPPRSTVMVVDQQGAVLVRFPADGRAGQALPDEFRMALAGSANGTMEHPGLNDMPRVFGVARPGGNLAGLTVAAGLSRDAASAEINAATLRSALLIGFGALLALVAAWIAGRQLIHKPIEALVAASERWRRGDWTARADLVDGSSELHRLGSAFDRMAGDLAAREAERLSTLDRERLLMREVDHRAKNALTIAQSVMRLTRAESIQQYVDKVQGRIAALARTHSLLANNGWDGADLEELVRDELGSVEDRIRASGPPVRLAACDVQPIGMILHELATNAIQHGALSVPEGHVELHWWQEADGGLGLKWCELGGPSVRGATSDGPTGGFGSRLIRGTAVDQLRAEIEFEWAYAGLCFTMRLPGSATPEPAIAEAARKRPCLG